MKKPNIRKADAFIDTTNKEMHLLLAKAKELEALNRHVANYLDTGIRNLCQVANLVGHRLILVAANGSIATQMRFQSADLIRKFKQDPALKHIQSLECKVRPTPPPHTITKPRTQVTKMACLSPETAEIVRNIADTIEDKQLRETMLKIAENVL